MDGSACLTRRCNECGATATAVWCGGRSGNGGQAERCSNRETRCNGQAGFRYEPRIAGLDERPNVEGVRIVPELYARWRQLDGDHQSGGYR